MMDERYTSAYEPTVHDEGTPAYEWEDYEEEEEELRPPGPRILWGRVIALLVLLFLVFLVGWWMAPDGISQGQYDQAVAAQQEAEGQIDSLESENQTLEGRVTQLEDQVTRLESQAEEGDTATAAGEDTTGTTGGDGTAAGEGENQYYTVQEGDTLAEISIQFYEDPFLADVIAEANPEISDADKLEIGDTLVIPDRPEL